MTGRRTSRGSMLTLSMPLLWVLGFIAVPYAILFVYSFWTSEFPTFRPDFQLGNYRQLVEDDQFRQVLFRSLRIAGAVAVCALLVAYPYAYFLAFKVRRRRNQTLLYLAVVAPLWVSYLLRAYMWKPILGSSGLVNSILINAGILDEPSQLFLFNQTAMIVTLTSVFIPFMVIPVFAALEKVPDSLKEASRDLGGSRLDTFLRVTLPMSAPGIIAGFTVTFALAFGDFIASLLVGGADGLMIANVLASQFGASLNWPLGAALALVMLVVVLAVISASDRLERAAGASRLAEQPARSMPDESQRAGGRTGRARLEAAAWRALLVGVLGFLYVPVAVMIAFSFNSARSLSWPMAGLSFEWYRTLAENDVMLDALRNSLVVATGATLLSLVIGVPAAIALDRLDFPGKAAFRKLVLLPIALPGVITGIALLTLFNAMNVSLSLWTVVLGHATALLAVVVTQVFARLQRVPRNLEEASSDLGASEIATFFLVTLPAIRTAVLGAGILSFTLSFDEIPVTFFLTGRENTLPMYIWSTLRRGLTPEINAIGTLIVLVSLVLIVASTRLLSDQPGHKPSSA